jgi:hypothetical protein
MKTKAQRQKTLKELADAIAVRNHVMTLVNGPRGVATKEEVTKLRSFVTDVDKQVMSEVLALDAPVAAPQPSKKDLDMAAARAKMDLDKKEAETRAKLTGASSEEEEKPAKPAKQVAKKPAPKPRKGVVQRVLD